MSHQSCVHCAVSPIVLATSTFCVVVARPTVSAHGECLPRLSPRLHTTSLQLGKHILVWSRPRSHPASPAPCPVANFVSMNILNQLQNDCQDRKHSPWLYSPRAAVSCCGSFAWLVAQRWSRSCAAGTYLCAHRLQIRKRSLPPESSSLTSHAYVRVVICFTATQDVQEPSVHRKGGFLLA